MTEKELVKGFQETMKDGINTLTECVARLNSLNDIEKFQKRLQATADNVKTVLDMLESYLAVQDYYNKHMNKGEDADE